MDQTNVAITADNVNVPQNRGAIERRYLRLLQLRIAQLEIQASDVGAIDDEKDDPDVKITELEPESGSNNDLEALSEQISPRMGRLVSVSSHKRHDKDGNDASTRPERTTFGRVMHESNSKKGIYTKIEITSLELRKIYEDITEGAARSARSPASGDRLQLRSPFKEFVWYWKAFEEACKPVDGEDLPRSQARADLNQLMTLVRRSHLAPYFKAREKSVSSRSMPYGYLWTLFPPGTKVCAKTFMDDVQMLEVHHCQTPSAGGLKWTQGEFIVHCIGVDWDGSRFSAVGYDLRIEKAKEQADIKFDTLAVYPMEYHRNAKSLKQDLLERGKRFWELCGPDKFQYAHTGLMLASVPAESVASQLPLSRRNADVARREAGENDQESGSTFTKKYHSGQIIVDPHSFLDGQDTFSVGGPPLGEIGVHGYIKCSCKVCTQSSVIQWHNQFSDSTAGVKEYDLFAQESDRLMMCPPRVLGFALVNKMWAQFRVSDCKEGKNETEYRRRIFKDQLQLSDNYKKMLLAFVNNHQSSKSRDKSQMPLDVIEGKGKGLAVLLHGPPGVGKTLTAETIALATGRPLLMISVAEIGSKATTVEANLNVYFTMAARWGAILLIDEADVYLEERVRTDNPERNMLVSVFLRGLEYYEGIIFLTTNRIRSIDVAVQSRMHLAIQYKRLTVKQKSAIYRNLLNKVPDEMIGERAELFDTIDDALCRRNEVNGRQIRNIVSAALALAKERGNSGGNAKLKFTDLRRVHETTIDFLDSLKDTTTVARARNEIVEDGGARSD